MNWINWNAVGTVTAFAFCGAILSASLDANGAIQIEWSTNSNERAYYWLSFTPAHDGTRVTITCDGPSNLGNLVVIANEGQSCSVPLLIGAVYRVRSNWTLDEISSSDPDADIRPTVALRLLRGGSAGATGPSDDFEVERHLDLDLAGGDGGGSLSSVPDVGVAFDSVVGGCCSVDLSGSNYVWSCAGCHCSGYSQEWRIGAVWEGYRRFFWTSVQCPCQRHNEEDPDAWFSLSCPSVIVKDGSSHVVSCSFDPPCETNATLSLSCVAGSDKIAVLASGDGWQEIRGVAKSGAADDVTFELTLTIGGETYRHTRTLTVAEVVRMDVTSAVQGESANPPPFMAGVDYPFSVTNSPIPDKHLVVPFCNVATLAEGGFSVADFSVDMNLVLEPIGVDASSLYCEWECVEASPQMSGTLSHTNSPAAHFVNPKQGGVYRFRGRCDGSPWTQANVVLPLCGASIDAVFDADPELLPCRHQRLAQWSVFQRPRTGAVASCVEHERHRRRVYHEGLRHHVLRLRGNVELAAAPHTRRIARHASRLHEQIPSIEAGLRGLSRIRHSRPRRQLPNPGAAAPHSARNADEQRTYPQAVLGEQSVVAGLVD